MTSVDQAKRDKVDSRRWGVALAEYAQKGANVSESTDLQTLLHGSPLTAADAWWGEEADVVEGYDLVKDKALFSLVGVPFRIYTLTYRQGIQQKGCEWRNDYASAELRVAPAQIILHDFDRILSRRTGKLIADPRAIASPGEQLVVNDGSTGFYRQTVQYLEQKELIRVPEALPKEGGKNECRYDLPASMWEIAPGAIREEIARVYVGPTGEHVTIFELARPLACVRGLRYSDYENQYTDDDGAITWYIA